MRNLVFVPGVSCVLAGVLCHEALLIGLGFAVHFAAVALAWWLGWASEP